MTELLRCTTIFDVPFRKQNAMERQVIDRAFAHRKQHAKPRRTFPIFKCIFYIREASGYSMNASSSIDCSFKLRKEAVGGTPISIGYRNNVRLGNNLRAAEKSSSGSKGLNTRVRSRSRRKSITLFRRLKTCVEFSPPRREKARESTFTNVSRRGYGFRISDIPIINPIVF